MNSRDLLTLACATLAFSLLGIVIRATSLTGLVVAGGRALFALPGCWLWVVATRGKRSGVALIPKRTDLIRVAAGGLFLAGNWYFYAVALKASSVAVAVVALFTYPLITALLEPLLNRRRPEWPAVVSGAAIIAGVALLSPGTGWDDPSWAGIAFGVLAGLSFALRTIISRPLTSRYPSGLLMAWQFTIPVVLLGPSFLANIGTVEPGDWALLVVLGTVLTSGGLILFTASLRGLSGAVASVGMSMQPVLSIVLALVLLGERPEARTWLGALVITVSVVLVVRGKPAKPERPAPE